MSTLNGPLVNLMLTVAPMLTNARLAIRLFLGVGLSSSAFSPSPRLENPSSVLSSGRHPPVSVRLGPHPGIATTRHDGNCIRTSLYS